MNRPRLLLATYIAAWAMTILMLCWILIGRNNHSSALLPSELDEWNRLPETLDLSGRTLSQEEMRRLGQKTSLRDLFVPNNTTDEDLALLSGLAVTDLSIGADGIRGPGLARLSEFRELSCLALHGANDGMLAHLPELVGIRRLYISGHRVTNAGVRLLAERFPAVTILEIENTSVDDLGVKDVVKLQDVTRLSLYHNPVTDASLDEIEKLPELRMLSCGRSGITAAGIENLKRRRPLLRVEIDNGD